MNDGLTRRNFLGGCAALGSTTLFSGLSQLALTGRAAAQSHPGDYKALVCILLIGGNDSFNMVVPRNLVPYLEYAAVRSDLALPREALLPIRPASLEGRHFGLHPNMPEAKALFDAGRLAVVSNVGTLVEPGLGAEFVNGSKRSPLGLYSHADQIDQWQTSVPDRRDAVGVAGRLADLMRDLNGDPTVSMNISLAGSNVWQSGRDATSFALTPQGSVGIQPIDDPFLEQLRATAVDGLLSQQYENLLEQAFADSLRGAQEGHERFSQALSGATPIAQPFSAHPLSQGLGMVARTIAARGALGARRQTFFLAFGSFDHHDEVLNTQAPMLAAVSRALGEFDAALGELGVRDEVTTFTISDFGRTLTSNGRGSDHGWGGNQLVMGGAVRGADFYGTWPSLYAGNPLDTGRGRLVPTLSTDEYFAELALWFGVSPGMLPDVLPNLHRFVTPGAGAPVGFLA